MKKLVSLLKRLRIPVTVIVVVLTSLALGIHNATLYEPKHGFDGIGHVFYIKYLYSHHQVPPPDLDWETHQSPLYYVLGALLMGITKTVKTAQYMNTFILWGVIGIVGVGLWRVFKKKEPVLIGMFSLAALPMLNIFPAMITNELLSTFFIISAIVSLLFLITLKKDDEEQFYKYCIWFTLSVVLGMWTKVSMISLAPTIVAGFGILFVQKSINRKKLILTTTVMLVITILLSAPLFIRTRSAYGPSNIKKIATAKIYPRPPDFFYRLDWIPKVDMYNTQYYSLLGGAWNSYWSDGQNAVTPFVKFHKKAFILWTLGFLLLPLSIYGIIKLGKFNRNTAILMSVLGLNMLAFYVYYNLVSDHYSAARLTYEMGIVLAYAFGIASAFQNKKLRIVILPALFIQFGIMVSFYWILDWWFVTK